MRTFLLFLLFILPLYAEAAAPPELICAPEARITFQSRWLRGSILTVETAGLNSEMPWTGREASVTGRQLRSERIRDFETTEAAAQDELLNVVPEETLYVIYKQRGERKNPSADAIYVEQSLLQGGEQDGIVIARQNSRVSIFHCRSR